MNPTNNRYLYAIACFLVFTLAACSPEPGSKAWCEDMDKKPKGDWSTNEAVEYSKSCLFD